MKRIISFAVSVLMVMTVFCGVLTVGSSAADAAGKITFTSVAGPINEDGTFELKVYANDLTDYGFFNIYTRLSFDTDVFDFAPVVITDTSDETYRVVADVSNAYKAGIAMSKQKNGPSLTNVSQITVYDSNEDELDNAYMELQDSFIKNATVAYCYATNSKHYPVRYNKTYLENYTNPSVYSVNDIEFDENGNMLYATYYLKVKDKNAVGTYTFDVSLDDEQSVVANNYVKYMQTKQDIDWTLATGKGKSVPATITLGSSTDITTSVADSASIRLNADKNPARCGLRFVGTINVPEAKQSDVVDFGIAITDENNLNAENKSDVTIGTDGKQVVLKIPAKVNTNGESLRKTDGSIDWTKAADATFSGVISSIKTTNYSRTFTAKVYYQLSDGTVVYSTGTIDRSVKQVYTSMLADETANQDAVAWVKDYFKGHMN